MPATEIKVSNARNKGTAPTGEWERGCGVDPSSTRVRRVARPVPLARCASRNSEKTLEMQFLPTRMQPGQVAFCQRQTTGVWPKGNMRETPAGQAMKRGTLLRQRSIALNPERIYAFGSIDSFVQLFFESLAVICSQFTT